MSNLCSATISSHIPIGTAKFDSAYPQRGGTEWEEYWATFTSPKDVAAKVGLRGGPAINYWVDVIKFYEGEYVPTEIDGQKIAVFPRSRLATTWAALKARPGLRNETIESQKL